MNLVSPLKGWVAPLAEVADPVFAGRMLGDGVAIDPTGEMLHAPCDGEVVSLARTRHAVTLRTRAGMDVLIHLGLETVGLRGEGFTAYVVDGQTVKAGDPLIGFDPDHLARHARSLITPIVIANGERFGIDWRALDREIEVGQPLMTLTAMPAPGAGGVVEPAHRRVVTLGLPHGLHARPAGRVAALLKPFDARIEITLGERIADARSPVALMRLGAAVGRSLVVAGTGPDAGRAVGALADFLASGGAEGSEPPPAAAPIARPQLRPGVLTGITAAPGLAVGRTTRLQRAEISVPRDGAGVDTERAALTQALWSVRRGPAAAGAAGEVMAAHLALLDDPGLRARADAEIDAGRSAGFAWGSALDEQAQTLSSLPDPRLRERAQDLVDLKRRVQQALGGTAAQVEAPPEGAILLADDLLPSELIAFGDRIVGLATASGGPTSHVAIIAGSIGLPALVALGEGLLAAEPGATVILDADAGELRTAPNAVEIAAAQAERSRRAAARRSALTAAAAPCRMSDGTRIEVFANLGRVEEAAFAVANGAEGCGLLRTEFLFLDRATAPDEAEQRAAYQAIADALGARPLIVRTLDIGGDKPVAYLPGPAEANPALGLRGVRQTLARPDLLGTQLRAILGVTSAGHLRIMVPMIANVEELRAVRRALHAARAEMGGADDIELGVMVETPAAALIAAELALEADFLSIGTNDLTQYALAMDRGNPAVAAGIDALHPAVLRLIALTCEGAAKVGKWVGVCGALASDTAAAPLLIGLGVTELSAAPHTIPDLKSAIRLLDLDRCRFIARQALAQPDTASVRAVLGKALVREAAQ